MVLTIFFDDDADYVAVEETLPAGLEAVNTQLKTSGLGRRARTKRSTKQNTTLDWYVNHREFHPDRIRLFMDYIPRGFYQYRYFVKATNAGEYLVAPAKVFEMYDAEIFGTYPAETVVVE